MPEVFRPIQYLGCKLRALPSILRVVESVVAPPANVLDLFAGSTVVAQALARSGFRVISNDVLEFSAVFARALLADKRGTVDTERFLAAFATRAAVSPAQLGLEPWYSREAEAIERRDADELLRISRQVPQLWRTEGASPLQRRQFADLTAAIGAPAFHLGTLVSAHYAGTYFGVRQAVEIDRLRVGIEQAYPEGECDAWVRDVLLTALISVTSDCVFSPGKHFAQAHRIDELKDQTFFRQRILRDRSIFVAAVFQERVKTIVRFAEGMSGHRVISGEFEKLKDPQAQLGAVDLIYADPPYTEQQYSRFYHLPETLVGYRVPQLQLHRGRPTAGLYPSGRIKSRFSSKRETPAAFTDLIELSKSLQADLLLSYSGSRSGRTGNDRMIGLDQLLSLFGRHFNSDQLRLIEFEHEYRQFNRHASAVPGREDREFLLYCRHHA